MTALFMHIQYSPIDLTATSDSKKELLQADIVPILIDAVGAPNHSQKFYRQAICNLFVLAEISAEDEDGMKVDERVMQQLLENRGCEAVLARLKNGSMGPFVTHGCVLFLYLTMDHVPLATRADMSLDVLTAAEISFGRNVEASYEESDFIFLLCCQLMLMAFHEVRQSRDSDILSRAVRFALQGYVFFHGEEDPRAQDCAKMLVKALVGEDEAKEMIDHCKDHCARYAPSA